MSEIVIQILGETRRGQLVRAPSPCEFAVECNAFTIGSNPDSTPHVRIDNPTVSRRHLTVESLGNDRWIARDAGSDNGTILLDSGDDAADSIFGDKDWHASCQRISEVEIDCPAMLLIGDVVVRLVPVAAASALVQTTSVGEGSSH